MGGFPRLIWYEQFQAKLTSLTCIDFITIGTYITSGSKFKMFRETNILFFSQISEFISKQSVHYTEEK